MSRMCIALILIIILYTTRFSLFSLPYRLDDSKQKLKISIMWNNLPNKWQFASSLGTQKKIEILELPITVLNSIYIAGKFRVYKLPCCGLNSNLIVSLYGKFDMHDKLIINWLKDIIKVQRMFFADYNCPYYFISLLESKNRKFIAGIRLHNSFVGFMPIGLKPYEYKILFTHEHLHNWIVADGENGVSDYWFQEGFTDYYARLLCFRYGIISFNEFVSEFNEMLKKYYSSPVISFSAKKIEKDYMKSPHAQELPYPRCFVFAIYLDNLIKKNSNNLYSLDSVMQDLIQTKENFSVNLFKNIVKKYLKNGIEKELLEFIDDGKIINLKDLADILPLKQVKLGSYDLWLSDY